MPASRHQITLLLQLFDFDIEVKPILEVLVGKTIEQALMEVMEEEELANLRAQQVNEASFFHFLVSYCIVNSRLQSDTSRIKTC